MDISSSLTWFICLQHWWHAEGKLFCPKNVSLCFCLFWHLINLMELQIYSNGLYESTLHRVINNSPKYRVCVAYFYEVSQYLPLLTNVFRQKLAIDLIHTMCTSWTDSTERSSRVYKTLFLFLFLTKIAMAHQIFFFFGMNRPTMIQQWSLWKFVNSGLGELESLTELFMENI